MQIRAQIFPAILTVLFLSLMAFGQGGPSISSISPTVGPVSPIGAPVIVKGSSFGSTQGSSTVTFGGIIVTPSSWSDTRISVPVPRNLPSGFADVIVIVNGASSNSRSFLVIPVITGISPASGPVGTNVTFTGTSFGDQQGTSTVTFNGVAATPTSWSNTSVTAPVPIGATDGPLVATINGFATNGVPFFVLPNITSVQPTAAPTGAVVTITGTTFGQTQGFGTVTFNGTIATIQSWSDTTITTIVPQAATTGNIIVTNGKLLASSGVEFTVSGLATNRHLHSATVLDNGKILFAGGVSCPTADNCTYLSTAEIYDPNAGTFTSTGSMAAARSAPAVLLPNGKVLIGGGYSCDSGGHCSSLSSAELYDPSSGTFTTAGNLTAARNGHTMTLLNTGNVLIAGGETCLAAASCGPLNSAELYDPQAGTFAPSSATLAQARFGAAATLLKSGGVLIAGGSDGTNVTGVGEVYFPTSDFFSPTANHLGTPRSQATATLLNNGKILIAGGSTCGAPGCPAGAAELYDPANGRFSNTAGGLNVGRFGHTATLLNNGQVLIAGGYSSCASSCTSTPGTELYDAVNNTFSSSQALLLARAGHSASLLSTGAVLLGGGINQGVTLSSPDSYLPSSLTPSGLVSIAISPGNRSFLPGANLQLTAVGTFSGGGTQTLQSATWASTDNTIAAITGDSTDHGWAHAVANGAVTVSACAGSICGTTTLTVGPPSITSILITPASASIPAGTPQKFTAAAIFSDGTTQDVTSSVTWSSTSPQVATISSTGFANGLTVGTTTISATLGSNSSSVSVTVQPAVLITIAVQPALGGTTVGGTQQFSALGTYTDGTTQNLTATVTWISFRTTTATISAGGLATGVAGGSATITAKLGGASSTAALNVASGTTPPAITATASPAPNAQGWNNTNVTVTFQCTAGSSAVATCPGPQTISSEGSNQTISGTVVDAAGNTATAGLTINLDKSRPAMTVASPLEGAVLSDPAVTVSGTVSDALSGVSALSCNGTPVTVSGGSFSCSASLTPGINLIRVVATDVAGNVSASSIHASLAAPFPAPVSLAITPSNVSILVDDTRSFSVVDELGRPRTDATWSISDNTIATLATDGSGALTGVAPGHITLTATMQAVSAQITVNVFSGDTLPVGTVNWSLSQGPGSTVQNIVQAEPVAAPDLYSTGSGIRALTADGQQLWLAQEGAPTTLPDNNGGLLLIDPSHSVIDLDAQTGKRIWEYHTASNTYPDPDQVQKFAVGQDGTIYFREGHLVQDPVVGGMTDVIWSLVSLDGDTGARTTLYTVPTSTRTLVDLCKGGQFTFPTNNSFLSDPIVGPDGAVLVEAMVRNEIDGSPCGGGERALNPGVTFSLVQVPLGGSAVSTPFQTISSIFPDGSVPLGSPHDVIPDGQGGQLAPWIIYAFPGLHSQYHVFHSGTDFTLPLPGIGLLTMVLGDNSTFFATNHAQIVAMGLSGGNKWLWTAPQGTVDLQLIAASPGGGLIAKYNLGDGDIVVRFDASGQPTLDTWDISASGTAIGFQNFGYLPSGSWFGQTSGLIQAISGESFDITPGVWSDAEGAPQHNRKTARAHPVNYRVLTARDSGLANHIAEITEVDIWDSSTGNTPDLKDCMIAESVTYKGGTNQPCDPNDSSKGTCLFPPSPPWPIDFPFTNPVFEVMADDASVLLPLTFMLNKPGLADRSSFPTTGFVKPYSPITITGIQIHNYKCGAGKWIPFLGPHVKGKPAAPDKFTITRQIIQNSSGQWIGTMSKTGTGINVISTLALPVQ